MVLFARPPHLRGRGAQFVRELPRRVLVRRDDAIDSAPRLCSRSWADLRS
jgi:hypothetical protein